MIGDELEDRDDIKMLTKHSKATGQKEQETAAKETKYLQDFANIFEDDDSTSDKVKKELADIAQKRWGQKQGKYGTTVSKYFIFHWKDCTMYKFFININHAIKKVPFLILDKNFLQQYISIKKALVERDRIVLT